MKIAAIDHLVLTVSDLQRTLDFYTGALGMAATTFGNDRIALAFGTQKINLHLAGAEFEPRAARPVPGSGDICFLTDEPLDMVIAHLRRRSIKIVEGPVRRTGATGPIRSVYIRDPDGNLIELANRVGSEAGLLDEQA